MTRSTQTLIAAMVAVGLGMPEVASAQARTAPAGSSSAGTATERPAPSSGGSSSATPSGVGSGGGSSAGAPSSAGSGGSSGPVGAPSGGLSTGQPVPSRNRSGQPTVGTASSRMLGTVTGLPGPIFGPWGRYYPWYSTGFGWNFGFVQLSPYSDSMGLLWGPSYDPFSYDPFNPFGYGYNGFRYGGASGAYGSMTDRTASSPAPTTHATGSIRLKVSPDTAKVYVDGILAGTANQFDGLFGHHLVLESGPHQLELRADGFETYHETMTVDEGHTQTERLSLTKAK
jgi:hypothetical protein